MTSRPGWMLGGLLMLAGCTDAMAPVAAARDVDIRVPRLAEAGARMDGPRATAIVTETADGDSLPPDAETTVLTVTASGSISSTEIQGRSEVEYVGTHAEGSLTITIYYGVNPVGQQRFPAVGFAIETWAFPKVGMLQIYGAIPLGGACGYRALVQADGRVWNQWLFTPKMAERSDSDFATFSQPECRETIVRGTSPGHADGGPVSEQQETVTYIVCYWEDHYVNDVFVNRIYLGCYVF